MKKVIFSLIMILIPLSHMAQQAGDIFTIKTTDGKTAEWSLAGGNKNGDISIIKHKGNKIELYAKGYENIGAWQTYDIENIDNITFTVFHQGDYQEETAVEAVKNMGLGTNFGNCTDVIAMWLNMDNNSVTDFEKAWGQVPTTKPMVDFLKKNGFHSVRIPVTWFQHMKEDGTVDEAWMNRIQEIVDYVIDNDMYCILNVHHDTGADDEDVKHWIKADEANYKENKEKFEYLWTQIATRFDVLNNLAIPTDKVDGHIAVEVHTYSPWDWFAKGKWDASCSKEIADMFTRLNRKFISKGIPCIIGEYGTHGSKSVSKNSSASEIQAAADQAADIVKQAKAYGVATFYWMSIFDGTDRSVPQWTLPTVVEAMKKAYNE